MFAVGVRDSQPDTLGVSLKWGCEGDVETLHLGWVSRAAWWKHRASLLSCHTLPSAVSSRLFATESLWNYFQ